MKVSFVLILLLSWVNISLAQVSFGDPQKINDGWKFQKGDAPKASLPEFDDSKWRQVDLPHDWSVEGPLSPNLASATGYLPGGTGWYRKTFTIPSEMKNKKVFIYFEGIYRNSEVYINGTSLGMRPNGYISFLYELTPYLRYGGPNTIAVRADHSKYADSRWYTGSGIYRDVYLIFSNPVHINQWGVFYTTPLVTSRQATIQVATTIKNTTNGPSALTVNQEILDKNQKVVAKSLQKFTVSADTTGTVIQNLKIANPMLWSTENPYLYQLKTTVYQGSTLIDQNVTQMGIRTLTFSPDKGFSLNGKSMKVKGVCLHHDAGCLGSAVPKEVWQRRLATLKSLGCNAIRTSHNPQAPLLYDLCDEMGFLVMDEALDEWEFPKKKWLEGWNVGAPGMDGTFEFFEKWVDTDVRDMVVRDRNHPSIFMWSIGNEVDYPNDPYSHPSLNKEEIGQPHVRGYLPDHPNAERLGGIAKRLASVVRRYDTSRPVTAALAGPVMSNETEYPGTLDVVGYNYTENRYALDHAAYPKRIFYGSENGQSLDAWKAVQDNDYIFGQFLWTGIDYLGEAHRWPSRGFTSGLLDLAGYKKPRAYFRESLWSNTPMAYLGTYPKRNNSYLSIDALPLWNYREGDTIRVVCYTNCPKAQLRLNGEKVGESKNYDDKTGILSWDIPYQAGKLEVIGYREDKEAARFAIETTKRPDAIKTTVLNETSASEKGVIQVEIQITDEDGKPVLLADNEITCTTQGPVKLLGLEASNPTDMGDYTDNKQRVYQGRMIAYLKSTGLKGKARISFSSPWLKDANIDLDID